MKLALDLETYSDIDLPSCGVYRYIAGDFHILLCAYAFDSEPVQIVDLANGEELPQRVINAVLSNDVIKTAWNAQFERICLSKHLRTYLSPDSWRCSMVHAASLAIPLSLKDAAEFLNVENKKDMAGERLIRYFSVPCKPTKTNGGRTRNLPEHEYYPGDWQKFKDYCLQDVRTERSIRELLDCYPMSEREWELYHLDQRINDRGVLIDINIVKQAIKCDAIISEHAMDTMKKLTGIENPNSVMQLKAWLKDNGVEISSLGKKDVAEIIHGITGTPREVLRLRQIMSKSSIKKYQAAERCVCADGRARGLFQFSGAKRTQRWCLAEGTRILVKTEHGLITEKPIEDVELNDAVFDGNDWVRHDGAVFSGYKQVITWDGVTATPDHEVYIDENTSITLAEAKEKEINLWRA